MGGICSKSSCRTGRKDKKEEGKFIGIQVADPVNKDGVSQHGAEKQKDNRKQSISERVLGSKRMQKIKSIVGGTPGAQKAPGWPSWLTSVASDAVQGWAPRSADSYEMLDKVSTYCLIV